MVKMVGLYVVVVVVYGNFQIMIILEIVIVLVWYDVFNVVDIEIFVVLFIDDIDIGDVYGVVQGYDVLCGWVSLFIIIVEFGCMYVYYGVVVVE